MDRRDPGRLFAATIVVATLGGCVSWTPGWELAREKPFEPPRDVAALRARAVAAAASPFDFRGLHDQIRAWQDVLRAAPDDYEALVNLSSEWTLAGIAYARTIGQRGEYYRHALQYAERAMALDGAFLAAVRSGTGVATAAATLPRERVDALGWWTTALALYFDQCQGEAVKLGHPDVPRAILRAAARLADLDPAWWGSAPPFLAAVANLGLPERDGGGRALAAAAMDRAVEADPAWLRNRWARGAWIAKATGDDIRGRTDLEWVAAQDPRTAPGSPAWNEFFVRSARSLLRGAWF
jgi:hypothetical protein